MKYESDKVVGMTERQAERFLDEHDLWDEVKALLFHYIYPARIAVVQTVLHN